MVVCANCGEEDFYQQDGFFFCANCQSQSQHFREEGLERGFEDPSVFSDAQLDRRSQKSAKQKDRGRPWMMDEGFTVILKKQVEKLISRGARPELKDKVFKLWVHYLRTKKVAFCKDAKWMKNKHERNFQVHTNKRKGNKSRYHKKSTSNENKKEDGGDDEYESSEDEFCLDLEDYGKRDVESAEWMTVRKTIIFLYLGLLYSGHNVTLADLIRWGHQNVFPYANTSNCLNSDMKFVDRGVTTLVFCQRTRTPEMFTLRRYTGAMATFLGLDNIPNPDMKQLTASYVIRLALPGELHASVKYLMDEVPLHFKPSAAPLNYDLMALTYIIVALKLLLGFDDFRERQLSSYARELTKKLDLKQKLFIWDDWVNMQQKRMKRLKQLEKPKVLSDAKEITNVGQFLEHQNLHTTRRIRDTKVFSCMREDVQREIKAPLESLISKIPDTPTEGATSHQESETLFSETLMEDFEFETSDEPQPTQKTIKPILTEEEMKFTSTTFRYISEGVDFLEHLGNHGITNTTLSMYNIDEEDRGSQSEETNKVIAAIRQAVLLGLRKDRHNVDADDQLAQLSQKLSLKKDCYMIYNYGNKNYHASYQWLLNLCSDLIWTPAHMIQGQVRLLELLLFKVSSKNYCCQTVTLMKHGHFDPDKVMELEALAADEDEMDVLPLEEDD